MRFSIPLLIGPILLLILVALSAYLLLLACAVPLPLQTGLSRCHTPQKTALQTALHNSTETRTALHRRIFELERELAQLQCEPEPRDPNAPLNEQGWQQRDLGMFQGCWELDSSYRTRDVDTGVIRNYQSWQMCFDLEGRGQQVMRATDGMECRGEVRIRFQEAGIELVEPGNLDCADGGYIHQRQISCVPADNGEATCFTKQPETGGEAEVGFRRAVQ